MSAGLRINCSNCSGCVYVGIGEAIPNMRRMAEPSQSNLGSWETDQLHSISTDTIVQKNCSRVVKQPAAPHSRWNNESPRDCNLYMIRLAWEGF